ncbi:hypothetical protein VIGAN_10031200 [Vigna angularis var. angularis]|uniref:Uncharacterized protein n=1 Tax=Vigna angularis var. angularis TaxID=157739 RepID=A0A0S3T254_PHAAN|nr:hypothetical protein VIGAN_10031200 [Vigna angularis var. angularis]
MKARAGQLHTDLRAQNLDNKTMKLLLGQIKSIKDDLAGIGCLVKPDEYVYAINEGLLPDYAVVISAIESNFQTPSITKVEALLLGHEFWTTHHQQKFFPPSVHYSQAPSNSASPRFFSRGKSFQAGSNHCGF